MTWLQDISTGFIFFATFLLSYRFFKRRVVQEKIIDRLNSLVVIQPTGDGGSDPQLFKNHKENLIKKKIETYFQYARERNKRQPEFIKRILKNPHLLRIAPIVFITCFFGIFGLKQFLKQTYFVTSMISVFGSLILGAVLHEMLENRRRQAFMKSFPQALDIIMRALQAGLSIEKSFKLVGKELEGQIGQEFTQICDAIEIGMPFSQALIASARRMQMTEYDFFIAALNIQRYVGGSLVEFMDEISVVLRRREDVILKIKSLSAEAKMTGLILGSLPFLTLLALSILKEGYVEKFRDHPTGRVLIIVALLLLLAAAGVIKRLARFSGV